MNGENAFRMYLTFLLYCKGGGKVSQVGGNFTRVVFFFFEVLLILRIACFDRQCPDTVVGQNVPCYEKRLLCGYVGNKSVLATILRKLGLLEIGSGW